MRGGVIDKLRRLLGVITFALCLLWLMASVASAQKMPQIMSAEKEAALRASIPVIADEELAAKIGEAMLYTDAEMPGAYQFQTLRGGQGVGVTTFMSPNFKHNNLDPTTHGHEFPWRAPGGLDNAERFCDEFRFIWLPKRDDGKRWPMAIYQGRMQKALADNMPAPIGMRWVYPKGTIFGEVLVMNFSDGMKYTFEMRIREREIDDWEVQVFRPFRNVDDLIEKIAELRGPDHPAIAQLARPRQLTSYRFTDANHARRSVTLSAGVDDLPPMDSKLVRELLTDTVFYDAGGNDWFTDARGIAAFAPSNPRVQESIVPPGYQATFIGTSRDTCINCHKHASAHVDRFDPRRDWYGYVKGGDGIFSFHPIEPSAISRNGFSAPWRYRQAFVSAGLITNYSRDLPSSMYALAPDYTPSDPQNFNPRTNRRIIGFER